MSSPWGSLPWGGDPWGNYEGNYVSPNPAFNAIPTAETEIGLAIETTRGVAQGPQFWFPVMSPKYKPDLKLLPDETLQGSMVTTYDEIPGLRADTHGWDSHLYLDSLPVLLRAILGSPDNITSAASSTSLSSSAAAGASTISTAASIAAGSYVVIDTGVGMQETRLTSGVTGAGPYTVSLAYPLSFAHSASATVTGLTKHQFSLLNNSNSTSNQPPSVTICDYAGDAWRELTGGQLDELTISGAADTLPKYTCTWQANVAVTPSTPSPSYTTTAAAPGWTLTSSVGGTQLGYVVSWEVAMKRGVKNIPAITGNQNYYEHWAGPLTATAKLVVLQDPSSTQLNAYEVGTSESLDLTLNDVKSGYALNLHSSKFKYTTGEIDRSKEYVEVPLDIELLPSSTDATAGGVSPILATVANAQTGSY